ncbi:MAG: hypothetical protein A2452_03445 [Candidatus Firestonebacteria bacterium RIFOXYC2_FULL_39_67]|nr:MAG: hypothetical protein A2536_02860 [Candidatus Firestonebacteria bacterium RIFOXYD2_FULL_39_29]OGF55322.1 MAG: hypothetical protein A2452_03445 [Candidatus Firestonebacteria bacterium RIFOXYC2_FULL_39_67]
MKGEQVDKKWTVLVIDDEQDLREMLSFTLMNEGYNVLTAANGKLGVEKAEKEDVDVIISDIKMPEMDGITVLGKVKEMKPGIEVIMATGFGTMETAIESLRKGAFDFIHKPYNIDQLIALIIKACETKKLKSQVISLQQMDKLKDEFLSIVSHELKTPLASISGAIQLLMDDEGVDEETLIKNNSQENQKLLKMISRNADKIRKLIDNLLDFAKMESGFWELKITDIKMPEIMDDIPVTVKPVASLKNIEVVMGTSLSGQKYDCEKLLFKGDMDQIGRVVVNFVTNAVKYTPENGKVCVWAEKSENDIKVVVEDNGKGIAAENLQKVFDKFYRVDQHLKKLEAGFGLGLAICKKIIELHKGKLWAESDGLGKGSRFIFTIPVI